MPPDKYSNVEEFINDIELIGEIEFAYNGVAYSLATVENGISVVEYNKPETEQLFESAEDFIAKFEINGKKIKDIVTKIDVLFH